MRIRMLTALTHVPSPALQHCELTYMSPQPIDYAAALRQHEAYCQTLRACGAHVVTLQGNDAFPDSVFVEDPAIVLDEVAISTPMGVASRAPEAVLIARTLAQYRPVARIAAPAMLEGGDVLRLGRTLYVGLSTRTNEAGVDALRAVVAPHGYTVVPVRVPGCLHLKTGCTALSDDTVLINPAWVDTMPLQQVALVPIAADEPFAANVLRIGTHIMAHAGFPATIALLQRHGYDVVTTDITEFTKAEAGLTCMSLLFGD